MDISVEQKSSLGLYATPLLHQTSFWSAVKHRQGVATLAFDIKVLGSDVSDGPLLNFYEVDDILILLQEIGNGFTIGYVPYGPAIRPDDDRMGTFLEELSEALRPFVGSTCLLLRYDLPWESPWARDAEYYSPEGDWFGPPSPSSQELRLNFCTRNWNLRKATTDILPTDTSMISLKNDAEHLLGAMKGKTRYNIALADRKHVEVRTGSEQDIPVFYDLYRQTCQRNGINLHNPSYFSAMFQAALEHSNESEEGFELLVAEVAGQPLSAMFLTYSYQRATYLFGASASYGRETMSTYALQWEAIQRAKDHSCAEYDLFGTAPNRAEGHPMHGLYRFKTGFGGRAVHRMGCWDYPLDPQRYLQYVASEMTGQGYHVK